VRPDELGPALGQVHTAADGDADKTRAKNAASPPKQMSTGDAAAGKGAKGAAPGAAAPGAPKAAKPGAAEHAEKPVKGEVPGGQEHKQAQQDQATRQQQGAGEAIVAAANTNASWFGSGFGGAAGEGEAKMSDEEQANMAGSLDNLATTGSGISTDPGAAPDHAMQGEAKTTSGRDRAALETKTAGAVTPGRSDAAVPMCEDDI
jgi:hypothetical protein